MEVWKSIGGMIQVELTSADTAAALEAISRLGIEILDVRQISQLTIRFQLHRRDYRRLLALCEKRGDSLRLLGKRGLYWAVRRLTMRPVLLGGVLLLLMLSAWLPTRVLFVRVEGNSSVPARLILEAAEESGICFGASRREVRSEKVKNALLSAVPQLQWAGINTTGCTATISVQERDTQEEKEENYAVSSIVASRDGYILSADVTRGTALCAVGQVVREGQVLISGYTDCGICIQAGRAEGEIFAQTGRTLTVVSPSEWEGKGEKRDTMRKISLILGKKRINLWKDSGILEGSCGRMYEEYYITLPGGFRLPVALCVEEYSLYEMEPGYREASQTALQSFAQVYLQGQMVAGSIRESSEQISREEDRTVLTGEYTCVEMIGKRRREQIGETNEQSG